MGTIDEDKLWDALNGAALVLLDRDLAEDFMKEVAERLANDLEFDDLKKLEMALAQRDEARVQLESARKALEQAAFQAGQWARTTKGPNDRTVALALAQFCRDALQPDGGGNGR